MGTGLSGRRPAVVLAVADPAVRIRNRTKRRAADFRILARRAVDVESITDAGAARKGTMGYRVRFALPTPDKPEVALPHGRARVSLTEARCPRTVVEPLSSGDIAVISKRD